MLIPYGSIKVPGQTDIEGYTHSVANVSIWLDEILWMHTIKFYPPSKKLVPNVSLSSHKDEVEELTGLK